MGTRRYTLVFGALMLAVEGLAVHLGLLVWSGQDEAARLAERQQRMVTPVPARPGGIFARTQGRYILMAASKQVPSCYADPFLLEDREVADTAVKVAEALHMDPVKVQDDLVARRQGRFAWLKRGLSDEDVQMLRLLRLPAVGITYEWQRVYPNERLGGTVIGFRLRDGQAGGGIELSQDRHLSAEDGVRVMLADAGRRPIWLLPEQCAPPSDGGDVYLTLDVVVQGYLQEAVSRAVEQYGAKWGTGVVVDPFTGSVLAMASTPTFDPNCYNQVSAEERANRAVTMPYEPGSVMKPVFAAAAVDAGVVRYDTKIFCENGVYFAERGGRITDHGHHYGWLTVEDVIVKSSNIGMAKIGEKLGNTRLREVATRFGLGERTGVELPGESPGILRPLGRWDTYSLRRVPFGQEVSTTALQIAMAFCPLANGGVMVRPRLVACLTDAVGRTIWQGRPEVLRRVLKPETAEQSLAALTGVVERGTGKGCSLDRWTSFGKTGTAQIPGPGGYVEGAYTASFLGGAPAKRPRVLCLISIYWPQMSRGYYGGTVAAPYVKEVLERTLTYLDVPPDKQWVKVPSGQISVTRRGGSSEPRW